MALVLAAWMAVFLLGKDTKKKIFVLVSSLLLMAVYRGEYVQVSLVLCGYALVLAGHHLKGVPAPVKAAFGLGIVLLVAMNGIFMDDYRLIRPEQAVCALLFFALSVILYGLSYKSTKIRIVLTVLLIAAGAAFGLRYLFSTVIPVTVFLLIHFLEQPFSKMVSGIKDSIWVKNKERDSAKEGDAFMNSKRGRLLCGVALLMIPVMAAFVFCIYKLNNKINSVYLITQQIMDDMGGQISLEDYVTQEKLDEIISRRMEALAGDKPKDFSISRFTEADGMSFITCDTGSEDTYRLYQPDMNEDAGGLGYVLQLPTGNLVVFDGGYEGDGPKLHDFIVEHGGVVNAWILTHPHYDHIGAFLHCMTEDYADMDVQNVYYAPFTAEFFDSEEYTDNELEYEALRFNEFEELRKAASDVSYIAVEKGDRIQVENLLFKCLSSFDAGRKGVNDNSLVLRIEMNGVSMLLTGDMTEASVEQMISEIGEDSPEWNVDFLQIPHHGYTGTGRKFYELTKPRFALLDCSTKEYEENVLNIQSETIHVLHEVGAGVVKRFEGTNVVVIK